MRRARAFIGNRRAAARAETSCGFGRRVLIAREAGLALGDTKTLAPASDIGGIGRAMRAAARRRMIVPGPARRHVDLEGDLAAQALAGGGLAERDGLGFFLFKFWFRKHFRALSSHSVIASEAKQSILFSVRRDGLLRFARN